MSEDFAMDEFEVHITDELTLAESSRPDDPVVESDGSWRLSPTDVKAYEARLRSLRGAAEAMEDDRPVQAAITAEAVTVVGDSSLDITLPGPRPWRRRRDG